MSGAMGSSLAPTSSSSPSNPGTTLGPAPLPPTGNPTATSSGDTADPLCVAVWSAAGGTDESVAEDRRGKAPTSPPPARKQRPHTHAHTHTYTHARKKSESPRPGPTRTSKRSSHKQSQAVTRTWLLNCPVPACLVGSSSRGPNTTAASKGLEVDAESCMRCTSLVGRTST